MNSGLVVLRKVSKEKDEDFYRAYINIIEFRVKKDFSSIAIINNRLSHK